MKTILTTTLTIASLCACALFTSCQTSSISNPGSGGGYSHGGNAFYTGELDSLSVLGVPSGEISDSSIRSALGKASGSSVRIPRGARILLVQSGAVHPDAGLQSAMSKHYEVVPFSGVPTKRNDKTKSADADAKRLRLAAAKAGVRYCVVVWGTLESSTGDLATSSVSWVPIAGRLITDEQKATRIVTTAVVMETASGTWRSVSTDPIVRKTLSSKVSRGAKWDRQVEALKAESYPALASRVSSM